MAIKSNRDYGAIILKLLADFRIYSVECRLDWLADYPDRTSPAATVPLRRGAPVVGHDARLPARAIETMSRKSGNSPQAVGISESNDLANHVIAALEVSAARLDGGRCPCVGSRLGVVGLLWECGVFRDDRRRVCELFLKN